MVPKDYRTYQIFKKDDLVFKLIDLENVRTSRVGLVHENGIMSSAYIRIAHDDRWNSRFLYYFFYHLYQAEIFNKIGSGVRSTLGASDLLDLPIPVIIKGTQDKIVAFLDEKTQQIDEAIGIKEQQISLLKERKQIIIQNAVTKGLNPNAPMKDSGIDWIGEIPAHWNLKKLKHLSKINRSALSENTAQDFQLNYVDISNVTFENGIENVEIYTFADAPSRARRIAKTGDTIVSTVRTYLKAIDYINDEKCHYIFSTGFAVVEPRSFVHPEYLTRFISSNPFTNQVDLEAKGVSYPSINSTELGNLMIALPPMNEMKDITDYINLHIAQIDTVIEKQIEQFNKLKEYKASLINSAVTGKIKVTGE